MKKLFAVSALSLSLAAPVFAQDPEPAPPEPSTAAPATTDVTAEPVVETVPESGAVPAATPAPYVEPKVPLVTTNQWISGMAGFYRPDPHHHAGVHGFTASALYGHEIAYGLFGEFNISGDFADKNSKDGRSFYQEGAMLDVGYELFGTRGVSFVTPFVIAGGGYEYNDVYERSKFVGTLVADGGIGLVSGEIIKPLRIRAEVRYYYNKFEGNKDDARANIGFEIPIGEPPAPPRAEFTLPPAQVVAAADELDSDHDSVPDSRDQCPGTPEGVKVDATGCPLPTTAISLPGVNFKTNSAKLQPSAPKALKKALDYLAANPDTPAEVAGHTDATGKAAKNMILSQARAETVRDYLIKHGVKASRLTAKGYGSTLPLRSPETTAEDRALNRRVELRVQN